ncbi:hypothetical protein [Reichenbachiella ulvae]|uniref:Uncharacterized protein n=1 Tax=Reichenbachiella ulvae TaxID=2980104 RepID=A0ABT3CS83_9BACT|nr:hypothetical protein [Reichenbachiella ulvae]MCV9386128.1 hypothetical protein [Reichenbachiella ulvae]
MATLTIALIGMAFYIVYHTSKRAVPTRFLKIERWFYYNETKTKSLSIMLLFIALSLAIILWGVAAGVLTFFVVLMTWGSLIVILSPIRVFTIKHLSVLFLLSLFSELFYL